MDDGEIDGEVRSHHDALAAWLARGDRRQLERFLAGHDEEFTLVTVDGANLDLPTLSVGLADAGGSQPALQLEVDEVRVLATTNDVVVVRFLETHRRTDEPGEVAQRWTTAVLRRDGDWCWLTVHETALSNR